MKAAVQDFELKARVLEALVAAGAEVALRQRDGGEGYIDRINGRHPRWRLSHGRFLGSRAESVNHIQVGQGSIGRGLKIIRPKAGVFDYVGIAQALIEDAAKQDVERRSAEEQSKLASEREERLYANAEILASIAEEHGGKVERFAVGGLPHTTQRTTHCRLSAYADSLKIETVASSEAEARMIVKAIEHALRGGLQ